LWQRRRWCIPLIVTIVKGRAYERMAEHTVPLMEECLGESVKILSGGEDSWASKLDLLAEETYTFVDVDVVFRKHHSLKEYERLAEEGFFVAPEPEYRDRLKLPDTFVTSGMFTLNPRKHSEMLGLARSKYVFKGIQSLKDEYALNDALLELNTPVHQLPLHVHRVAHTPGLDHVLRDTDVSRHYCGCSVGPVVRLAHIRNAAKEAWQNLKSPTAASVAPLR